LKHIKGLDTLRAIAVLIVIIEHWGPDFNAETQPIQYFIKQYFVPTGVFGVDLFFVLSGFLITAILLKAKSENKAENNLRVIKNFFVRRTLRIFPIYYLTLLVLMLIKYQFPYLTDHIIWYLTYRSDILFFEKNDWGAIPHTWSLAVEEQFYLLWPWLIIYIRDRYLKYVFGGGILIAIITGYITTVVLGKGNYPILVFNCMAGFGIGGAYAYAKRNEANCKKFEKALFYLFIPTLIVYCHWNYTHDSFWGATTFLFRIVDSIISLQLIVFVMNNKNAFIQKYILENRVLNFIGKISYGIYLYHLILQPIYDGYIGRLVGRHMSLQGTLNNYYVSYFIKLELVIGVSWLSYSLIEKPIMNYKKRFKYNISNSK